MFYFSAFIFSQENDNYIFTNEMINDNVYTNNTNEIVNSNYNVNYINEFDYNLEIGLICLNCI